MSSTTGWIRGKAEQSLQLYAKDGGVVIQADSLGLTSPADPTKQIDPDPGFRGVNIISKGTVNVAADSELVFATPATCLFTANTFYTEIGDTWVCKGKTILTESSNLTAHLSEGTIWTYSTKNVLTMGLTQTVLGVFGQTIATMSDKGITGLVDHDKLRDNAAPTLAKL